MTSYKFLLQKYERDRFTLSKNKALLSSPKVVCLFPAQSCFFVLFLMQCVISKNIIHVDCCWSHTQNQKFCLKLKLVWQQTQHELSAESILEKIDAFYNFKITLRISRETCFRLRTSEGMTSFPLGEWRLLRTATWRSFSYYLYDACSKEFYQNLAETP